MCLGSGILAFGMYHIHSQGVITEGGCIGLVLLLDHWLGLSPAISSAVLNGICFLIGIRVLGKEFLLLSAVSTVVFSGCYYLLEQMPLLFPQLHSMPLAAALIGGCFVGVGVGLCVRSGGAPSGDDALAMTINHVFRIPVDRIYLFSDAVVLLLSLSYISAGKVVYSLITVVLSGQIIGLMQKKNAQQ